MIKLYNFFLDSIRKFPEGKVFCCAILLLLFSPISLLANENPALTGTENPSVSKGGDSLTVNDTSQKALLFIGKDAVVSSLEAVNMNGGEIKYEKNTKIAEMPKKQKPVKSIPNKAPPKYAKTKQYKKIISKIYFSLPISSSEILISQGKSSSCAFSPNTYQIFHPEYGIFHLVSIPSYKQVIISYDFAYTTFVYSDAFSVRPPPIV